MKTLEIAERDGFPGALAAPGRSPEIPEEMDAYGWLVGDWDLDVLHFWVDVADRGLKAELHCAWVLEGRAIQDLWIMPRRGERAGYEDRTTNMYGTTLRIWDPALQAWRITWLNPVSNQHLTQVGRSVGKDVIQVGCLPDGIVTRWRFTEIRHDSFHWIGEAMAPDAQSWVLQGEFLARRRGA
jgi:hypothetical protein